MYTGPQRNQCSCGWCLFCIPEEKKPKCCQNNHHYYEEPDDNGIDKIAPASPLNKDDQFFGNDNDNGNELIINEPKLVENNENNNNNNTSNGEGLNTAKPGSTAIASMFGV